MKTRKRTKVFWGDEGAEALFKTINTQSAAIADAMSNPNSPVHKCINKQDLPKLWDRILKHYEFRAQLDWAKEQYYEVGSGTPSPINNLFLGVHGGEVSKFE